MKATKPTKEELQTLMSGATVEWVTSRNTKYRYSQKADGSLVGNANGFVGVGVNPNAMVPGSGTWHIDENGRYCITSKWGHNNLFDINWCSVVYKLGDDYYLTYVTRPDQKPLKMSVSK